MPFLFIRCYFFVLFSAHYWRICAAHQDGRSDARLWSEGDEVRVERNRGAHALAKQMQTLEHLKSKSCKWVQTGILFLLGERCKFENWARFLSLLALRDFLSLLLIFHILCTSIGFGSWFIIFWLNCHVAWNVWGLYGWPAAKSH